MSFQFEHQKIDHDFYSFLGRSRLLGRKLATLKTEFIKKFTEIASVLNENVKCEISEEDLSISNEESIISRLCFIATLWSLNEARINWYVNLDILKDATYLEKFQKLISYMNSKTDEIFVCID